MFSWARNIDLAECDQIFPTIQCHCYKLLEVCRTHNMPELTVDEDGDWKPIDDEDEVPYRFTTEYAKSSRARCRVCSEAIKKDTVRVGVPVKWGGGTYGYINSWRHLICTRRDNDDELVRVKDDVWGLANLKPSDQKLLQDEINKTGLPAHIKTIDPNDPDFLKKRQVPDGIVQPGAINLRMLKYQIEGFGWMVSSELSDARGGVLADEMGMGKTLQAIALIVATDAERQVVLSEYSKVETEAEVTKDAAVETALPHTPLRKKSKRRKKKKVDPVSQGQSSDDCEDEAFTPKSRKRLYKASEAPTEPQQTALQTEHPQHAAALATIQMPKIDESGPTLVVCPSSAMMQWNEEIIRSVNGTDLKVLMYYQNRKNIKKRDLMKYDVILTTYAVLEYEYRREENKQKVSCEYCSKLYLPRKLILHQKYFCGPDARRTKKQRKTERTRKEAIEKAKVTLKITKKKKPSSARKKGKKSMPTPSAIYKELMYDANREAVPMYKSSKPVHSACSSVDEAAKGVPKASPSNRAVSVQKIKVSRSVARLQDSLASGSGDPAPSTNYDSTALSPPRKRPLRASAKTSPYFSKRKSDAAKVRKEPTASQKFYIDDLDDDEHKASKGSRTVTKARSSSKKKLKGKRKPAKKKVQASSSSESESSEESSSESSSSSEDEDDDRLELTDRDGVNLRKSSLHRVFWKRIILDEAHKIKGRTNNTAKSVYALHASYRWCLTGTPLQNRVSELYALLRFLKIAPHCYYFCQVKGCPCISLHWQFGRESRKCTGCGHPPMRHFSYFNKYIMNPINRYGYIGDGRKAMIRLKKEVLDKMMLRRTKVERASDIKLPPLHVSVEKLTLTESEMDFYECIYKNSRSKFDTFVEKGVLLNNYAHIFQLLSRLRQTLDHPYLVVHGKFQGKTQNIPSKSRGMSDVCGICGFDIQNSGDCVLSACHHTFHRICLKEYSDEHAEQEPDDGSGKKKNKTPSKISGKKRKLQKKKSPSQPILSCPVCFVPLTVQLEVRGGMDETAAPAPGGADDPSVCIVCMDRKRNALLVPCGHMYTCVECTSAFRARKNACPVCRQTIRKVITATGTSKDQSKTSPSKLLLGKKSIVQQLNMDEFQTSTKVEALLKHIYAGAEKSIVFSQYNRMIDIVEWRLKNAGVNVVKLVGSMSLSQRSAVLKAFKTNPEVRVILMSLRAGGEGLNLQEATHVFVLEPWWNPAVEMQAISRAHRIGQTNPVHAIRFITENTVEERMLELQEKKQLVFEGTVDSSALALSQLTVEDLRFLFR